MLNNFVPRWYYLILGICVALFVATVVYAGHGRGKGRGRAFVVTAPTEPYDAGPDSGADPDAGPDGGFDADASPDADPPDVLGAPPDPEEDYYAMLGCLGQSNDCNQAYDTDASLTSGVDGGVFRGGADASDPMPEAVSGTGVGGTGLSVEGSETAFARGMNELGVPTLYLPPQITAGGHMIEDLDSDDPEWAVHFQGLNKMCEVLGGSNCFVPWVMSENHGESDRVNATAGYGTALAAWLDDYQTELSSMSTGGNWLSHYRTRMYKGLLANWAQMDGDIIEDDLINGSIISICQTDPDIICIGGNYHFGNSTRSVWNLPNNQVHMDGYGQLLQGVVNARVVNAYYRNLLDPIDEPIVFYPASITCTNNTCDVDYEGIPCEGYGDCAATSIALDTTNVACPWTGRQGGTCRYGFEYIDDSPNAPTLDSVAVIDDDTVRLTLSGNFREDAQIAYAWTALKLAHPGNGLDMVNQPQASGSPRGNLREDISGTTIADVHSTIDGQEPEIWATPFKITPSGGEAAPASVATIFDDLPLDYLLVGEDCPSSTDPWPNRGTAGGSMEHNAGSVTCGNTTGDSPAAMIGATNVDEAVDPASSTYEENDIDLHADDDVLFVWAGCANDADANQDLVHWWGNTQEYWRVFVGSTGTMTLQFDTRDNGGSGLVSQNLTSTFPNSAADRREMVAVLWSNHGSSNQSQVTMCSVGNGCATTAKGGTWEGLSVADLHFLSARTAANYVTSNTYGIGIGTGEKVRAFKRQYTGFETWWESAASTFCASPPCACDDGEAFSKSGFAISDLSLAHSDVEAELSIPEPPDANVTYIDGSSGAGLTISAGNTWIDCSGTSLGELTLASGVTNVYVANCRFVGNSSSNSDGTNDHIEFYNTTFEATSAGVQTFLNIGDNWLLNEVTMTHNDDYAWFASDFDEATMSFNIIVYNSRFRGGPTQSTVRLDGLYGTAWVDNLFDNNADTNPHNLRFQGGINPDAGSGDTGAFGAHLAEVKGNCMMGGSNVRICNLNSTELCGTIYFRENNLYSSAAVPDPMDINCDQIGALQMYGNAFSRINSSYNPWNQSTGGCAPDANTMHDYDAATFPDGGCSW